MDFNLIGSLYTDTAQFDQLAQELKDPDIADSNLDDLTAETNHYEKQLTDLQERVKKPTNSNSIPSLPPGSHIVLTDFTIPRADLSGPFFGKLRYKLESLTSSKPSSKKSRAELKGQLEASLKTAKAKQARKEELNNKVAQLWQQTFDPDIRCTLLNKLFVSYQNKAPISADDVQTEPQPIESPTKLTIGEVICNIDFYLRFENAFKPLTESVNNEVIKKIQTATLNQRIFLNPGATPGLLKAQALMNEEDIGIMRAINLMNRHPQLKSNFQLLNENISGMMELKTYLFSRLIYPWTIESSQATPPNGILFYGPPGCGKSHIADAIGKVSKAELVKYSKGSHGSPYKDQAAMEIDKMFTKAKEQYAKDKKPTVIFIDETSSVFPNRAHLKDAAGKEDEVDVFLQHMEGCSKKGVFIIGATNYPEKMDAAFLRTGRFDRKFYLSPPEKETRKQLFIDYLAKHPSRLKDIDYDRIADLTANFIASDIIEIVNDCISQSEVDDVPITTTIIAEDIAKKKPSLTAAQIATYQKFKFK